MPHRLWNERTVKQALLVPRDGVVPRRLASLRRAPSPSSRRTRLEARAAPCGTALAWLVLISRYGASTFTPCASKSKTLPRTSDGTGRAVRSRREEREGCRHVVYEALGGTQISVTVRGIRLTGRLPQSSVPPIPMLRDVSIASSASASDATSGAWCDPGVVVGAVRVLAVGRKEHRPRQPPCGSTASGGPPWYPTEFEITAAP